MKQHRGACQSRRQILPKLLVPMFVELRGLVAIGACGVAFPEFLTTLANLSVAFLEMQLIKRELGWGGGHALAVGRNILRDSAVFKESPEQGPGTKKGSILQLCLLQTSDPDPWRDKIS